MINCVYIPSLNRLLTLLAVCAMPLLYACGGGLGGSGDGGGGSRTVILPPELSADQLLFRSIPETVFVDLPDSLFDVSDSMTSSDATLGELGGAVSVINNYKTETALFLLAAESSWATLQTHCENTPLDTACTFTPEQIVTLYSSEMASWEYVAKYKQHQETLGDTPVSEAKISELTNLVLAKINSEQTLGSGTFTTFSTGSYKYELVTRLDLGNGNNFYTLRWTENLKDGFLSIVSIDANDPQALQVSKAQTSSGLRNSILLSNFVNDLRRETQFNVKQASNQDELQLEAQITQFGVDDRNDLYILGKAADNGGYVDSEQVLQAGNGLQNNRFTRQGFDNNAALQSLAICDNQVSTDACTATNSWRVELGEDPVNWPFYLSREEQAVLEGQLKPFDIDLQNVAADMDSFILLRRSNLSISVSAEGVLVTIPGFGTLDLTGGSAVPDASVNEVSDGSEGYTELVESVLCRVNVNKQSSQADYRSFCAGTAEEIENALVVGESFKEGEFKIEWQATAIVDVISR